MSINEKLLFDTVRIVAGRALTQKEVDAINAALGLHSEVAAHVLKDAGAFFAGVRKITGSLDEVQVSIINGLLTWAAHWSTGWLAYGLATAWHESRLRPIRERGNGDGPDADNLDDYLQKYDTCALAKALGNTPEADGDGVLYAGRGLVQLTGKTNYERAGVMLGVDLLKHPELALVPENAVRILVWGMEKGAFTGRSLGTYITPGLGTHSEFVQARRIINGTDRAELIAGYADQFKSALIAGGWA